eukprot:13549307-Alexandrium_andersonii.AAC.1
MCIRDRVHATALARHLATASGVPARGLQAGGKAPPLNGARTRQAVARAEALIKRHACACTALGWRLATA